ncbi:MAG: FMN-binding protein [Oscillospiraceae bacterium]
MNFYKDFLKPVLVLMTICLVVTGILAFAYNKTQPIIEQNAKKEADLARTEILPQGDTFSEVKLSETIGAIVDVYGADNGAGFVITAANKGYGGEVKAMIAINSDGKIEGIKVMENSETPGIGSRVIDDENIVNFLGKDENLEGVEDIKGVTYTSKAMRQNVVDAFAAFAEISKGENK